MAQEEWLFPGDFIANAEEFLPGEGTYLHDGKILAAETGVVQRDLDKRVVSIDGKTGRTPLMQMRGLDVIGVIAKVSDKAAFIDLLPVKDGKKTYVPVPASTVLRVNNIKRGFVKSLKDEFKIGDIVRVRILEVGQQDVLVSTEEPNLGVIKAFCVKCRHALDKDDHGLTCPRCGWKDQRHLANDYREGKI